MEELKTQMLQIIKFQAQQQDELRKTLLQLQLQTTRRFEQLTEVITNSIAHILKARKYSKQESSPSTSQPKKKPTNKRHEDLPPTPCTGCGHLHWYRDCPYRHKQCLNCDRVGHKTSHCRKKTTDSYIKNARLDVQDGRQARKYVQVKILNRNIKFQLDSGSDLTILNKHTWRKLGKPTMLRTSKVARSITGEKLNFLGEIITNVTHKGRTLKLRMSVMKNTNNLFGTDAMQKFRLWKSPNSFCQKIKKLSTEVEKLKKTLRQTNVQRKRTPKRSDKTFGNSSNRTERTFKNGTCSSSANTQNITIYKQPKPSQKLNRDQSKEQCVLLKTKTGSLNQNIAQNERQQRFWTKHKTSVPSPTEEDLSRYRQRYFSIFPDSNTKTAHFQVIYSKKQWHPD